MELFKKKTLIISGGAQGVGFAVAQAAGPEGMTRAMSVSHGFEAQGVLGATYGKASREASSARSYDQTGCCSSSSM